MKRFYLLINSFISFVYLELIFKYFVGFKVFENSLIIIVVYAIFLSLLVLLLFSFIKEDKYSKYYKIILFIQGIYFSIQLCIYNLFGFFFEIHSLSGANQLINFTSESFGQILRNSLGILMLFLPFIINVFLDIKYKKVKSDESISIVLTEFIIVFVLIMCLFTLKINNVSYYEAIGKNNNYSLSINKLGVSGSFGLDALKLIIGYDAPLQIKQEEEIDDLEIVEKNYTYNTLDIDFEKLSNETDDQEIKDLDLYFESQKGSLKNDYTSMFKDKNLIYIMAESFNEIAVSKELTPTLYSLIHDGFYFENYYSPDVYSTIGGEFQELTGLYFVPTSLGIWKSGDNYFPLGLANVFKKEGYSTYAYHNNNYYFQNRDTYLNALGFNNFKACGNGLEEKIGCKWLQSDLEMMENTIEEYINSDKFMVFYATVSGHGPYDDSNAYSVKYRDLVKEKLGNNYSEAVINYVASQIELENALSHLVNELKRKDKLDDTVIVLAADHHPYFLSDNEMNELSDKYRDNTFGIYHSNLIIYNPSIKKQTISKYCGTSDVLPTVYNLFGIEYDSRLFTGKDIFSNGTGYVIFSDHSWLCDYASYDSSISKFTSFNKIDINKKDRENLYNAVSNKISIAREIIRKDYYRHVFK